MRFAAACRTVHAPRGAAPHAATAAEARGESGATRPGLRSSFRAPAKRKQAGRTSVHRAVPNAHGMQLAGARCVLAVRAAPQHRRIHASSALPPTAKPLHVIATRTVPLAPPRSRRCVSAAASPWAALLPAAAVSAESVVRRFYTAVNARDLPAALALVDENCRYEDMIYASAFVGKDAVAKHLTTVFATLPADFAFAIDGSWPRIERRSFPPALTHARVRRAGGVARRRRGADVAR